MFAFEREVELLRLLELAPELEDGLGRRCVGREGELEALQASRASAIFNPLAAGCPCLGERSWQMEVAARLDFGGPFASTHVVVFQPYPVLQSLFHRQDISQDVNLKNVKRLVDCRLQKSL